MCSSDCIVFSLAVDIFLDLYYPIQKPDKSEAKEDIDVAKTKTSTFVTEVPLITSSQDRKVLEAGLYQACQLYNVCLVCTTPQMFSG